MTKPEHIALELEVKVLNINEHKGNKIVQSCKPLAEYSMFVETVRRNIEGDKEHGFENAIKECIKLICDAVMKNVHPCPAQKNISVYFVGRRGAVQKLKFLDSPIVSERNHGHPCPY